MGKVTDLRQQLISNRRHTVYIYIVFFLTILAFSAVVATLIYGDSNTTNMPWMLFKVIIFMLVITGLYSYIMVKKSVPIIMYMNKANRINNRSDAPVLFDVVSEMAIAAGEPLPEIFIVQDTSPNAFSAGNLHRRNGQWIGQAGIGVTSQLLKILNREQLESVIGHEMGHIKDEDTRVESVGIALTAIFSFIGNWATTIAWFSDDNNNSDNDDSGDMIFIIIAIAGWICCGISYLAQLALSRNREYLADAESVNLTRDPQGLIQTFEKLSDRPNMKSANPNCNSLYFANPNPEVSRSKFSMANILDTHPSLHDRITRLENM